MKVRLSNQQIRIRLNEKDLEMLLQKKAVTTVTAFSPTHRFEIILECNSKFVLDSIFENNKWRVIIPFETLQRDFSDELILRETINHPDFTTELLVEVDLPCKH